MIVVPGLYPHIFRLASVFFFVLAVSAGVAPLVLVPEGIGVLEGSASLLGLAVVGETLTRAPHRCGRADRLFCTRDGREYHCAIVWVRGRQRN